MTEGGLSTPDDRGRRQREARDEFDQVVPNDRDQTPKVEAGLAYQSELSALLEASEDRPVARWRTLSGDLFILHPTLEDAQQCIREHGGLIERLPWPVEIEELAACPRCPEGRLHEVAYGGPDLLCPTCDHEAESVYHPEVFAKAERTATPRD